MAGLLTLATFAGCGLDGIGDASLFAFGVHATPVGERHEIGLPEGFADSVQRPDEVIHGAASQSTLPNNIYDRDHNAGRSEPVWRSVHS